MLYRIQGRSEKERGVYYEFDSEDRPLGEGGMGKVFKGRRVDEKTGNSLDVAIKFMYSDLPPYAIEKARREASIHLKHENLIEMLGFIETTSKSVIGETQYHYHVVSELLEGVSLDALLEGRLVDQEGFLVPYAEKLYKDYQQDANRFAVNLVRQILSGLLCMHDAGFIHRDIDPTNIMITSDGRIKLIDFGIAKKMNALTTNDKHLTQAGQFVGKAEYAAPELVVGAIHDQNQTTDLYAVGIMLFQCVVGHLPFEGDKSDIMMKQRFSKLPLKQVKDKGLRAIIAKATEKAREKRYQSAAEFRVDLERWNQAPRPIIEWKRSYTYVLCGVAACAIAGVVVFNLPDAEPVHPDYASAMSKLSSDDKSKAFEGLEDLKLLSTEGSSEATYTLSRIYFHSAHEEQNEAVYSNIRSTLGIPVDNKEAHKMLATALKQDSDNYKAAYELALDYWQFTERSEAVEERDYKMAESLFRGTLSSATAVNDKRYINLANDGLKRCSIYVDNLEKVKEFQKQDGR